MTVLHLAWIVLLCFWNTSSSSAFVLRYPCDKFQYAKSDQRITTTGDELVAARYGRRSAPPSSSHRHLSSIKRTMHQNPEKSMEPLHTTVLDGNNGSSGSSSTFSDQLQLLKDSVNIVDLVESYDLEGFRRLGDGNRATAVCPFHDDRNPSLSIDANRQIYKCFACGAGGDIFRFVQEYSKLPGQNEFESFGDVLRHISSNFGDGTVGFGSGSYSPRISSEEQQILQKKKDRIFAANAAAAVFYADCLVKPFAGGARLQLRSRGLASRETIHTFALGFAPDVYYGEQQKENRKRVWGDGSLVNLLRDLNFTATEILDAGLAVQTQKSRVRSNKPSNGMVADEKVPDYTSIMDRFRGRLVVPIFDRSGKKILGFGGREIPPPDSEFQVDKKPGEFYNPKYLNSPETLVFEKRKVLFGEHIAKQAIRDSKSSSEIASTSALLIVEGYMDAISLWTAGIRTVVASMGTALSPEQLDEAARTAGTRGGRIVLCLDNDDAGIAACGRLCSNGMLSAAMTKHVVDIAVAQLPESIKDPAEFFESQISSGASRTELAERFRKDIIESAVDWTDWYIQSIVAEYNKDAIKGSTGSFNDIFERVADFLATTLRPADRTKRAYEVAGMLSSLIAKERNATEASKAASMQLESDLIDHAARISDAKEAIHRRAEKIGGFTPAEARSAVSAMARGQGPSGDEQEAKLSFKARLEQKQKDDTSILPTKARKDKWQNQTRSRDGTKQKPYRAKMKRRKESKSLTPHFSGFHFTHRTDADWLGLNEKEKWKRMQNNLVLGHRPLTFAERVAQNDDQEFTSSSLQERLVYFNSADFNGHQFLTDDAMQAGYKSSHLKPDPSVVEKGIASIVEADIPSMIVAAENALLRALVKYKPARTTAKNILDARNAVHVADDIFWSNPAREWLFDRLIRNSNELPSSLCQPDELRSFVSNLPDAPLGAFANVTSVANRTSGMNGASWSNGVQDESSMVNGIRNSSLQVNQSLEEDLGVKSAFDIATCGSLDSFFIENPTSDDVIGGTDWDSTGDLVVQELLVNLFWTSAAMKASFLRKELSSLAKRRESESSQTFNPQNSSNDNASAGITGADSLVSLYNHSFMANGTASMDLNGHTKDPAPASSAVELEAQIMELLAELRDTTRSLLALKQSAERITCRLMDSNFADGVEGHLSLALQSDLANRVDDHLREICSREEHGFVADNDEPYEIALERMAEEWGEWFDDEYVWSSNDSTDASFPDLYGEGDEGDNESETLEEGMARIELEWAGFLD